MPASCAQLRPGSGVPAGGSARCVAAGAARSSGKSRGGTNGMRTGSEVAVIEGMSGSFRVTGVASIRTGRS